MFNPAHGVKAGIVIGTLLVALPLGASDPTARLRLIAAERARVKRSQKAFAEPVRADADRFPDLDVLSAAMERDWQALAGSVAR